MRNAFDSVPTVRITRGEHARLVHDVRVAGGKDFRCIYAAWISGGKPVRTGCMLPESWVSTVHILVPRYESRVGRTRVIVWSVLYELPMGSKNELSSSPTYHESTLRMLLVFRKPRLHSLVTAACERPNRSVGGVH